MKKLIFTALTTLIVVSLFAQQGKKGFKKENFTTEQLAILKTKKMTLHLDLNESQQKQILEINKKLIAERKKMRSQREGNEELKKDLSSDELFKRKSEHLDRKIAHKKQMKRILDDKQFEKWEKREMRKKKMSHNKQRHHKKNRMHRDRKNHR